MRVAPRPTSQLRPLSTTPEPPPSSTEATLDVDHALSLVSKTIKDKLRASEAKIAMLEARLAEGKLEWKSKNSKLRAVTAQRDKLQDIAVKNLAEFARRDRVIEAAKVLTDLGSRVGWKKREEATDRLKEVIDEYYAGGDWEKA